ncbi:MAG: hypothetical protein ACM3SX_10355, partial [Deltaproteobacteria bacterium]
FIEERDDVRGKQRRDQAVLGFSLRWRHGVLPSAPGLAASTYVEVARPDNPFHSAMANAE